MPIVSLEGEKSFDLESGETLYNALEKQGYKLPSGCLSGSCGACRVHILDKPESLEPPGVIEKNTVESIHKNLQNKNQEVPLEHIRLSCRAKIKGSFTFKILI